MPSRPRVLGLLAGATLVGSLILAGTASATASAYPDTSQRDRLDHIFVIMLENHGESSVIGDANAPYLTSLAHTYGQAVNYFGVTHPSEPNYVASISGSNWFINDDNPANTYNHTNLVDQLESHGLSWAAYMESMPSAGFTGAQYPANTPLYANKHNPFVLFDDVRNSPSRLAKVKPFTSFAADMAEEHIPSFVWITPNQCHDMHGGAVQVATDGSDGTPCPFSDDAGLKQKADAFVQSTVQTIMASKAWKQNSAIFVVGDENDFDFPNTATDRWATAAGCCDSPVLPNGYVFSDGLVWHGVPDGNGGTTFVYGGGLVPAVVVTSHGPRGVVSQHPYNHYSLLRTIEQNWHLGYLENASDSAQVQAMTDLLGR